MTEQFLPTTGTCKACGNATDGSDPDCQYCSAPLADYVGNVDADRPAAPIYCFRDTARGWTAVILADDTRYYGRTPGQAADHARVDLDWRAIATEETAR